MKITKNQLKRIIKEEKAKFNENFHRAPFPMKSRADPEFAALIKEQPSISTEGSILANLSSTAKSIDEIANGLYGLQDPGDPGYAAGDELAGDLELQVERLNELFDKIERYFESMDDLVGRNPGGNIG